MDQQTTTKDLTDPRKMTCWWKSEIRLTRDYYYGSRFDI